MRVTFFIATCALNFVTALGTPAPTVRIDEGYVRGTVKTSAGGRQYYAFEGIPYAEPPVGSRRFQEPEPSTPWSGVWIADSPGSECLQYAHQSLPNEKRVHGQEDCLFINVYTPQLPSSDNDLLDVVVYIHMGGFMYGAGHYYGPKYILDRNVVFVNFNYRLGILGFLSTGDEALPGNNGLKDQTLALKWIQKNIASFGGNPSSVTLTGTSAGGASVHYHYLSPLSKGLFHRGISFSGTALGPWAFAENEEEKSKHLGALLGCPVDNSNKLVDCLRNRPAKQIVELTTHFQPWSDMPFSPFGPVAEKSSKKPFISQHPLTILQNGDVHDLPWITTATSEEGLFVVIDYIANESYFQDLDRKFNDLAPYILDYNYTVVPISKIPEVGEKIRHFYFGNKKIDRSSITQLIRIISDRHVYIPAEDSARLMSRRNKLPVYFYLFSYRGAHSWSEVVLHDNTNYGCSHGDDIAYIFDSYYSKTDETDNDRKMSKLLLDIFDSYFKKGEPAVPDVFGITWPAVSSNSKNLTYLHIMDPDNLKVEYTEDLGNKKFWRTLPIQEPRVARRKITEEL